MVIQVNAPATAGVEIKSIKIETAKPEDGFADPMVWIQTGGETFTERLSDMMAWLRGRGTIRNFDQKYHEVNPGDGLGWRSTFVWLFSPDCPIQDHDVIGAWVTERVTRRDAFKQKIEFFIHGH